MLDKTSGGLPCRDRMVGTEAPSGVSVTQAKDHRRRLQEAGWDALLFKPGCYKSCSQQCLQDHAERRLPARPSLTLPMQDREALFPVRPEHAWKSPYHT